MKKILLTAMVFMLFVGSFAYAVPDKPNQFYGTVQVNGEPASNGLSVVVKINGIEVASTTTSGGKYGYEPIFYVPDTDPPSRSGRTLNFFVEGVDTGQTSTFCNGCVDEFDLTVALSSGDGGSGGSGGGGGGSGGSDVSSTDTEDTEEIEDTGETESEDVCREKWVCTDWSACENGKQTRTCTEENACGTDLYKPYEEQPCVSEDTSQESGNVDFGATGRFLTSPLGFGLVGVLIIAAIGIIFWKKKGIKKAE